MQYHYNIFLYFCFDNRFFITQPPKFNSTHDNPDNTHDSPHTTHDYPTQHTIAFDNFTLKTQKSLDGERSTEAFEFYSDKAIVCL